MITSSFMRGALDLRCVLSVDAVMALGEAGAAAAEDLEGLLCAIAVGEVVTDDGVDLRIAEQPITQIPSMP